MTVPDADQALAEPALRPSASPGVEHDPAALRGCPFLLAEAGGWRLDLPTRDHRCAAFSPPAPLSPEKQARLCLTPTHTGCATYVASLAAREARLGLPTTDRATRWGLARTTTVIEDPGGLRARVLTLLLDRRRWPAIPAVLLTTTLFTLALSGFRAGIPSQPVATSSPGVPGPTPAGSPGVESTPAPTPAETVSTAPATATPTTGTSSAAPAPGPSPTFRTYTVRAGDTLSAIAGRLNTTVRAIADLNNLSSPDQLTVGQVLRIP